jgi:hypothetical protein
MGLPTTANIRKANDTQTTAHPNSTAVPPLEAHTKSGTDWTGQQNPFVGHERAIMDNPVQTVSVVIHTEYGGFHITKEMAEWLIKCGWEVVPDTRDKTDCPFTHLVKFGSNTYYHWNQDSIAFRTHPDLIACVQAIQKEQTGLKNNRDRPYIYNLTIKKVRINLEIEDYDDGHERVLCSLGKK